MPLEIETNPGPEDSSDGEILLNLIFAANVRYHIDKTGEPCLILPGEKLDRAYPIQSRRVRAYLAALAWNSVQLLPSSAELDRVLRVLEGLAWKNTPCDATRDQLWHSLQEKPVLQVVIEFMREREKHETHMQTLLKDLGLVAAQLKFDLYSKMWPKTAAHLSAHLRQEHNQAILEQCGVTLEITRDKKGAKVVLQRVTPRIPGEDEQPTASPATSHDNSQPAADLEKGDAGDADNRDQLADRILNRLNRHLNHKSTSEVNA